MAESAFSRLSPGIQQALFRLGWTSLRAIQAQAIQTLRTTSFDLIVSAPTAGGKTEAAFLPILSQLEEHPEQVVLYVSPLKALINDQWGRLDRLCQDLQIPVRRWHGDVSATEKRAFRDHPRGVLLITPESLESNFVNYGRALARIYAQTSFIVIDELHIFVDGVRGMHLRSLIARLCSTAGCQPRLVGLSATLGDPKLAQAFLRPDTPDQVQMLCETGGGREIRLGLRASLERPRAQTGDRLVRRLTAEEVILLAQALAGEAWQCSRPLAALGPGLGLPPRESAEPPRDALDDIADDIATHFQVGTNLVFGNSRATLEELADFLHEKAVGEKWAHDPFHVHHGSLSKSVREEVETRLRGELPATALCTSTLELGIDIGHVRTVGQIDPPWSVAAAIQRLGRSGRRAGEASRMRLYTRDETPQLDSSLTDLLFPRLLRSIAVVELLLQKWIEAKETERHHLSTLVHQLLSLLRQTGGLPASELYQQLCVRGPFRRVPKELFIRLLRGLGENQILEQIPTGEVILGLKGERLTAEHDFYAAFASNEIFSIRHDDQIVGEMPADKIPPKGQCFILNGRRWRVTEIGAAEKAAWVQPTRERVPPLFGGEGGDIDDRIFATIRDLLNNTAVPVYLDPAARLLLTTARTAAHGSGASSRGWVQTETHLLWYPWVGTRVIRSLRLMLQVKKIPHEVDEFAFWLPKTNASDFFGILHDLLVTEFSPEALAAEMAVKTFDKYDYLIPEEILDAVNAEDRIDLAGARKAIEKQLLLNGS